MNVTRTAMPKTIAICTVTKWVVRGEGQQFYQTPKSIELWQEEPLRFVRRWSKVKQVLFTEENA